ncbi:MAG: TolC family protein [Deltaproteobacteria bacterium]|nr:TolC family protein [Deltaproteobacteria bacterium]
MISIKLIRAHGLRMALPLALVFCLAAQALAADAADGLTLDAAWELALSHNKDVAAAREYAKKVRGIYVEARATALPKFTLQVGHYRDRDESQKAVGGPYMPTTHATSSAILSVDQVLFTWGQVGAAIRGAKVGLATADDELRLYRQAALRDVAEGFYDVLLVQELFSIAKENLAQKERHKDAAEKRLRAGLATDYDVLAARVAVDNARPDVIRTENGAVTARQRLAFLLGVDDIPSRIAGSLAGSLAGPVTECSMTCDDAYKKALSNRPELVGLSHQAEMAKEYVTVISSADKPRAALPRPGGTTSVREAAQIVASLEGTVSQAERLFSMAEKGFDYGVKTRLDVEDALLGLMQAKGGLAQARRDYLVARVKFLWSMGVLGEESK